MKKVTPVLMAIVFCALLLAGCSISSQSRQGQPLAVYSFSGENEFISVSNGVIVLDAEEEICYGGNLETRKDKFTDIASYSATIYLTSDGEENILMSNRVEDKTGGAINISEDIGKITGDILIPDDIDNLVDGLWFELKTVKVVLSLHNLILQRGKRILDISPPAFTSLYYNLIILIFITDGNLFSPLIPKLIPKLFHTTVCKFTIN